MSDHNAPDTEPATDQEQAFLAAYRELDEADRVLVWSAILEEFSRHPESGEVEG